MLVCVLAIDKACFPRCVIHEANCIVCAAVLRVFDFLCRCVRIHDDGTAYGILSVGFLPRDLNLKRPGNDDNCRVAVYKIAVLRRPHVSVLIGINRRFSVDISRIRCTGLNLPFRRIISAYRVDSFRGNIAALSFTLEECTAVEIIHVRSNEVVGCSVILVLAVDVDFLHEMLQKRCSRV